MGLIIESTKDKKIVIQGTEIEVPTIYGRVEYGARIDGKTIEIALYTFANKEVFDSNVSVLPTNVPMGSYGFELKNNEPQNLDTSLSLAKIVLEEQGFKVTIEQ